MSGEVRHTGVLPWGTAALETQAGDAGEEKKQLDIALTGRKPAAPGQTAERKSESGNREAWGLKSHERLSYLKLTTPPPPAPRPLEVLLAPCTPERRTGHLGK